jgi:2-keto-4-pentenoate hydratase/2-oxohepta-3-ene-1,7-dioic acid hydratase in catechol pathway
MKIICIGRNYADHARELGNEAHGQPVFFLKPDSALLRNNQPFFVPDFSSNLHYEVEILLKVCKVGKCINQKFAHRYYDHIGIGIDFTARDLQEECKAKGLPWEICKAFDRSAAVSRFVAKEELPSVRSIEFSLKKNGITVQKGNTADMIFGFEKIISYVSDYMTLKTGDIFFTGTPAGVGPVVPGDRLQAYIGDKCMMDFFVR